MVSCLHMDSRLRMDSRLQIWLSPGFPVGSFAYSHGLEWAFQAGIVCDEAGLRDWLADVLTHGSWWNDAVMFNAAAGALALCPPGGAAAAAHLAPITELALALCPSRERFQETVQQGNAMILAARAAWPCEMLDLAQGDTPYPVALALLCAGHGLACADVLPLYALAFMQNLVSASIRLGIIGQTSGQRILAALLPVAERQAAAAAASTLADLGNAALMSDFASAQHETQYTRIFRS